MFPDIGFQVLNEFFVDLGRSVLVAEVGPAGGDCLRAAHSIILGLAERFVVVALFGLLVGLLASGGAYVLVEELLFDFFELEVEDDVY